MAANDIFNKCKFEDVYDIHEELGKGGFATVSKCTHKKTGEHAAAKIIEISRRNKGCTRDKVIEEAELIRACSHDNIMKLQDAFDQRSNGKVTVVLVSELLNGGELFSKLEEQDYLSETESIVYLKQVFKALVYLHGLNIAHLDLKPENIMLTEKSGTKVKLVDFGLAHNFSDGKEYKMMAGTADFSAPEVCDFEPLGWYTDMWAMGVMVFQFLTGDSPFLGEGKQETFRNITAAEYDFDDVETEINPPVSDKAKEFVAQLLVKRGVKRMTAAQCLKHAWMTEKKVKKSTSKVSTAGIKAYQAKGKARLHWQHTRSKIFAVNSFVHLLEDGRKRASKRSAPADEGGVMTRATRASISGPSTCPYKIPNPGHSRSRLRRDQQTKTGVKPKKIKVETEMEFVDMDDV